MTSLYSCIRRVRVQADRAHLTGLFFKVWKHTAHPLPWPLSKMGEGKYSCCAQCGQGCRRSARTESMRSSPLQNGSLDGQERPQTPGYAIAIRKFSKDTGYSNLDD